MNVPRQKSESTIIKLECKIKWKSFIFRCQSSNDPHRPNRTTKERQSEHIDRLCLSGLWPSFSWAESSSLKLFAHLFTFCIYPVPSMESVWSGSGINMQKRQEVNSIHKCKLMRTRCWPDIANSVCKIKYMLLLWTRLVVYNKNRL